MKRQEELDDLTNELYHLAKKRISRREALSTASKIAIAATAASLAAGSAGYFLGSSLKKKLQEL
jgi:membrane protein YqaA with SNARE-associated domain